MTVVKRLIFAAGLVGVAVAALVVRPAPDIRLTEALAAPLGPDAAAIYVQIENSGRPDRLVAVSSPVGEALLYSPEAPLGPPLATGTGAQLAADGAHIRLTGASLAPGQLIPLTLTFAEAGQVTAKARLTDAATDGGASEVGLFGLGGLCRVGEGEPAPRLALRVAPEGEGWRILIDAEEFTFSEARLGLVHVPGEGHGHLYVGGMKLGRLYAPEARIGPLPPGRHTIRVTLNTNDHRAYVVDDVPVTATAEIRVPDP